jgi:hypothetical protein
MDTLKPGDKLTPGQSIVSNDGRFSMVLQTDGNLVVYRGPTALWDSKTVGRKVGSAVMQVNGEFVLYEIVTHARVWAPPDDPAFPGSILRMQNDGNAVIYHGATDVWSTQTDGAGDFLIGTSFNPKFRGVYGENTGGGDGVFGYGQNAGRGVVGVSDSHTGVEGNSTTGTALWGNSSSGIGVFASGGHLAGRFEGDVEITGDIRLVNMDCAEDFYIAGTTLIEAGTVMVLGDDEALQPSTVPYDNRVAGVISGAGNYKAGIVLGRLQSNRLRQPVALLGKTFCKVDAQSGAIEVGDLLTTSLAPGHAMKVDDPSRAFGAVIGKALRRHDAGQGLIPILIALQ